MDGAEEHILIRDLRPGLFPQDRTCDLGERGTAGDRCEPLGSDGVWTKRGPSSAPGKARLIAEDQTAEGVRDQTELSP